MMRRRVLIIGLGLVIAGVYLSGRLDHILYNVGLNYHVCATNGFGATFCGQQLTDYQNRVRGVQQQIQQSQATLTQQEQAAQQQATTAECQADPQLSFCTSP